MLADALMFYPPITSIVLRAIGVAIIVAAVAVGVRAQPADSGTTSGAMLEMCKVDTGGSAGNPAWARCAGRVEGWMTAHYVSLLAYGGSGRRLYCEPTEWDVRQIADVFIKWATENPEKMNQKWSNGLMKALQDAFPCNN